MINLRDADGDLRNHWYILALEREIPATEPVCRVLYDVPYVVFRNAAGEIGVLRDQCLHRGAQLSLGTVIAGTLRCPYHGWTYATDGQVVEIPSEGPGDHAQKSKKFCAHKVPMQVRDGCIWVWAGDPQAVTQAPSWSFPEAGNAEINSYFMITDFDNEVTHLVQNFMDVPHTVFVHSRWFRNRSLLRVPMRIDVQSSTVKATYEQPNDSIGFSERVLNPGKKKMVHTDEYIFPNITRVDYNFGDGFFIINSQCSPVSRYQTRVYTWIAYKVRFGRLLLPFIKFYTRRVIEQDVEIMKNQGDNLRASEARGESTDFKSTAADELHLAIDQMRRSGVGDRTAPSKMNFVKEREFWI